MSITSKLDLTQDQIKTIDQLVKKDIAGNNFIDSTQVKKATGLSDSQVQEVVKAMNNYNKLPEEIKDRTMNSVQIIDRTQSIKNAEKEEGNVIEKVSNFINNIGSLQVSADNCYSTVISYNWWGFWFDHSGCVAKSLSYEYQQLGNNSNWFGGICAAGVGGRLKNLWLSLIGGAICTLPGLALTSWGNTIGYQNDRCGNNGVYVAMVGFINPWQYIYSKC